MSAEPGGTATVVPFGAASLAGRFPVLHCEATLASDEPGTPSLDRNPTWMT